MLEDGPFHNLTPPSPFFSRVYIPGPVEKNKRGPRYCVFAVQILKKPLLPETSQPLRSLGQRWHSAASCRQVEAGSGRGVLCGGRGHIMMISCVVTIQVGVLGLHSIFYPFLPQEIKRSQLLSQFPNPPTCAGSNASSRRTTL